MNRVKPLTCTTYVLSLVRHMHITLPCGDSHLGRVALLRQGHLELDGRELLGCLAELAHEWPPTRIAVDLLEQGSLEHGDEVGILVGRGLVLQPLEGAVGLAAAGKAIPKSSSFSTRPR